MFFTNLFRAVPFFQTQFIVNPLNPNEVSLSINVSDGTTTGIWAFDVPADIMSARYTPNATALYASIADMQRTKCVQRLLAAGFTPAAAASVAQQAAANRASRNHGTGLGELIGDALTADRTGDGSDANDDDGDLTCTNVDLDWDDLRPLLMALSPGNWTAPRLVHSLPDPAYVYQLGAYVAGQPDPKAFAGLNNSHLFVASSVMAVQARPLPVQFAQPLDFVQFYDNDTQPVLGPVTHGKTVSLGMAPWNAAIVVVCGWPSITTNAGPETILLTTDAGLSWTAILGNLGVASYGPGSTIPVRPSSPVLIDAISSGGPDVVVIGTSTGVYFTVLAGPKAGQWIRIGTCVELPLVCCPTIIRFLHVQQSH